MAIFDSGRIIQFDTKEQVISAPASRSAARLAGVKNLAVSTILKVNGNEVIVRISGIDKEFRALIKSGLNFAIGQSVLIGIRPEHVVISETENENTVRMSLYKMVSGVTFMECRLASDTSPDIKIRASFLKARSSKLSEGFKLHGPFSP